MHSDDTVGSARARRRSADPRRQRDPVRTQQRILEAALEEFAARGYAGARTAQIARRAGVNEQLIAYYFGGKAQLLEELLQRWPAIALELNAAEQPLERIPASFFRFSVEHPAWARLMYWQSLADANTPPSSTADEQPAWLQAIRANLERRQRTGELADDLDPACVLLICIAAAGVSAVLPRTVRAVCGVPADSPEFIEQYADQLTRVLRHLTGRTGGQGPPPGTELDEGTPA